MTNAWDANACTMTVTANASAIHSSGPAFPFSIGGSPLSIAMPISHGPASAHSEDTTISAAVTVTPRRCGRSRLASSTRLRRRSSAASGADTSSACSAAMPRHDLASAGS